MQRIKSDLTKHVNKNVFLSLVMIHELSVWLEDENHKEKHEVWYFRKLEVAEVFEDVIKRQGIKTELRTVLGGVDANDPEKILYTLTPVEVSEFSSVERSWNNCKSEGGKGRRKLIVADIDPRDEVFLPPGVRKFTKKSSPILARMKMMKAS